MSRPSIVFADEPTGNLDSHASAEVLAFLRKSVDEFDQTIVMVTHDPLAAAYTDRWCSSATAGWSASCAPRRPMTSWSR